MTQDIQPTEQPGPPQNWGAPGQGGPEQGVPAEQPKKSGARKWASLAGTAVVVVGGGVYALTGGFGAGEPEVGDCVKTAGTSFEIVDCGSDEAEFKVVGIEEQKQTYADFQADTDTCLGFETAELALWYGEQITEEGTVTCAASL